MSNLLTHWNSLINDNKIISTRNSLREAYFNFCSEHKYIQVNNIPLASKEDKSVLFIGAGISAVKDILMNQRYIAGSNGVYLTQECIRTGAKDFMFDNSWIPNGQIYFEMLSNLSIPNRFNDVLNEFVDFTHSEIGVPYSRIKILSTRTEKFLSCLDIESKVLVEYDTKKSSFYNWVYGINGVYGRGISVNIFNTTTNSWMDIANVVSIFDCEHNEIGVESGFGYEFFITSSLSLKHPLMASKIFDVFPYKEGLALKYYYNLEAVANMKRTGVDCFNSDGRNHIYKQYLKSLQYIGEKINIDNKQIISDIGTYLKKIFPECECDMNPEIIFLENHKKFKYHFGGIVKRIRNCYQQIYNGEIPKEYIKEPIKMIKNYMKKHGIRYEEVSDDLEGLKNEYFYNDLIKELK